MNDANRRLFITILLCAAVAYGWSLFVEPRLNPEPPPGAEIVDAGGPALPAPTPAAAASSGAATAATKTPAVAGTDVPRGTIAPAAEAPALPRPPTKLVTLKSDKIKVELTSDGAALRSVELLGPKYLHSAIHGSDPKQVELVAPEASPLPLSLEVTAAAPGAAAANTGAILLPATAGYEVVSQDDRSVTFRARTAAGLEVTKKIALDPQAYKVDLSVEVKSALPLLGRLTVLSTGWSDPALGGTSFLSSYFSSRIQPPQAICKSGKELEQLQVAKPKAFTGTGEVGFTGINEQFFLVAVVPIQGAASQCRLDAAAGGALTAGLDVPLALAANSAQKIDFAAFAGPKLGEALDQVSPVLRESIDFGFWGIIVKVLLVSMRFLHDAVPPHNWGIAIILLTISIKLLTFPLTHKQMRSMQEMQRIQPQIDELKKKFAGDTTRQNQEQMKLFQEHGVNPMASCLPMLLQFPIWIALYNTLRVSAELYNSAFIHGWLDDLTAKDPYFIVPALMGVTTIITQILTPTPTSNPSQKAITYVMSGFFTLAMLNLPAGLTLYIFVNNLLSITQQVYLRRTMKIGPAANQTVAVSARR